jgi:hypothetical protein
VRLEKERVVAHGQFAEEGRDLLSGMAGMSRARAYSLVGVPIQCVSIRPEQPEALEALVSVVALEVESCLPRMQTQSE